jgi:hypothetical protein
MKEKYTITYINGRETVVNCDCMHIIDNAYNFYEYAEYDDESDIFICSIPFNNVLLVKLEK